MYPWLASLNGIEVFYLICAVIGSAFVLVRMGLLLFGMDGDIHSDVDVGGHDIDLHHADSDMGFKILSLQGLSAFLMMFGLVGLALYRESGSGALISLLGALAGGFATAWVIGKLFFLFNKLQASGNISIDSAVGAEGKVYLTIPDNGTGRVLVNVKNSLREFDASSNDGKRLETGIPIRVVWVDGNLLVVEKV